MTRVEKGRMTDEATPQEQEAQEAPPQIRIPIMPTSIDVAVLDGPEQDVMFLNMSTDVVSAMFAITRSQAIEFGSKLIESANKMKRQDKDAKITAIRKRLVVPGQ